MVNDLGQLRETRASSRLDSLIVSVAERLGASAKVETVFGTPVAHGDLLIVPVARARWGFGGGGGSTGDRDGGGGGGGIELSPAGFIELRAGRARFRPIFNPIQLVLPIGALALLMLGVWLARTRPRS